MAEADLVGEEQAGLPGAATRTGIVSFLAVFGGWAILVVVAAAAHEPWFDEAHAWLLSRDASYADLLSHWLRYEGHPPLWYLILSVPAKLGSPFVHMRVASIAIAALGLVLLWTMRGVPVMIRVLLPFTYFLAYQYTIVSRSYVLIFPLLIASVLLDPRKTGRIAPFVVVLVLLSNVSIHGFGMAAALAAVYAFEVRSEWRGMSAILKRRHVYAIAGLAVNGLILFFILRPPPDLAIAPRLGWNTVEVFHYAKGSIESTFFGPNLWSFAALVVLATWFHIKKVLLHFSLLLAVLFGLFGLYFAIWHEGLVSIVVFFVLIISFMNGVPERGWVRYLRYVVLGVTFAVLLHQIYWSYAAISNDLKGSYSGAADAARYIRSNGIDEAELYGAGFSALAIQPYFSSNVFDNYQITGGSSFWDWSTSNPWFYTPARTLDIGEMRAWMAAMISRKPEYFLVSAKFRSEREVYLRMLLENPEYEPVAAFEGTHFWKNGVIELESFMLFRRIT